MAIIKFKVFRDGCYTVVNNTFINDNRLDAREKGLLLVIMSKPDNWDMSVEGLRSFCSDGTTALRKGIQKLEEHGYLLRLNVRNARGNFGSRPYVVFERPLPVEKRNDPDYNPLADTELNDTFAISDADRTRWLGLTLGTAAPGHRVRARSEPLQPSVENQPVEKAAAENRPQINTVTQKTVSQKKVDKIPFPCGMESYPSYPETSEAAAEMVTTMYQQISDLAQAQNIADIHELPAPEEHPAETAYGDCWVPQRPHKDSRFDTRYAFDAFMQQARQSRTCSKYSPLEYTRVKELVKERISYDALCQQYGAERMNTVVDILMEVHSAVSGTFRVEGVEISAREIKNHFAKVNQFHVEHMFANLDKHTEPVKCMKSYMRTTLYNAIITMDEEIRGQVRQNGLWPSIQVPASSVGACA